MAPDEEQAARSHGVDLAELVDSFDTWRVEYQEHPAAWIATQRPAVNRVHVLAAYDLAGLRDKLASAESLSAALVELRGEFAASGFRFGTLWASAAADPHTRHLYARRGDVLLTARTIGEMRAKLGRELNGA